MISRILRPKPAESEGLLGNQVSNLGNTRHSRKKCELAILKSRVEDGWVELRRQSAGAIPAEFGELMTAMQGHFDHPPLPTGEHGIDEQERQRRWELLDTWMNVARALLETTQKIRDDIPVIIDGAGAGPEGLGTSLLEWLWDAEDYYELGILGDGVLDGLNRRHGNRLCHLLR